VAVLHLAADVHQTSSNLLQTSATLCDAATLLALVLHVGLQVPLFFAHSLSLSRHDCNTDPNIASLVSRTQHFFNRIKS